MVSCVTHCFCITLLDVNFTVFLMTCALSCVHELCLALLFIALFSSCVALAASLKQPCIARPLSHALCSAQPYLCLTLPVSHHLCIALHFSNASCITPPYLCMVLLVSHGQYFIAFEVSLSSVRLFMASHAFFFWQLPANIQIRFSEYCVLEKQCHFSDRIILPKQVDA